MATVKPRKRRSLRKSRGSAKAGAFRRGRAAKRAGFPNEGKSRRQFRTKPGIAKGF